MNNVEFKKIRYSDKETLQQFFNVYERTNLYPYYLNYGYEELNSNGSYKYAIIEIEDDKVLLCIKDIKLFTTKYKRMLGFPISLKGSYENELKVFEIAKDEIGCKNIQLREEEIVLLPEDFQTRERKLQDVDYYSDINQRVIDIQKRRFRVKHRINKYKGDMEFRLATPEDVPKIKKIHQSWVDFKTKNHIEIRSKRIFKNMFKNIENYMSEDSDIRLYILYYKGIAMGFTLLNDIGNGNCHQIVQQYYNHMNMPKIVVQDVLGMESLAEDVRKICTDMGQIFYYFLIERLHEEGYSKVSVAGTGKGKSLLEFKRNIHKEVNNYYLIELHESENVEE